MVIKKISAVLAACSALFFAGCTSFHVMQTVRFVDDDGRFVSVQYGVGDEDHVTTFVSPVNGKEIELKSKLRVRVRLDDGTSFTGFQCMNMLQSGTMYKTDDGEWMFLANGFTCMVFEYDKERRDHRVVFRGALAQPPTGGKKR
jgi:hypothetical protein